ncbi:MAG: alpha/beta fold hydrolase [Thermodesulfobacteriota bacterium]
MFAGKTLIPGPHGQLEAIYRPTREDAAHVALVLHPHPLYGGTMHNPVVFHCARALHEAGFETLRFNFPGVGDSTGAHGHGVGEVDDARAALDFLLERQPAARDVVVAGFSFGAAVGLRFGCDDARVHRLLAIAMPVGHYDVGFLASCTKPKLFVHGDRDDVAPLAALEELLARRHVPAAELRVVRGTGHFFDDRLDELRDEVGRFAAQR